MYICTDIHIYIYTCIHIYIDTYIHIYINTYIHIYTYTCLHIYMYTSIHMYRYTHILYVYIYIHIYRSTHRLILSNIDVHDNRSISSYPSASQHPPPCMYKGIVSIVWLMGCSDPTTPRSQASDLMCFDPAH